MKNIVVFASGSGSNFEAIVNACEKNQIEASVCLLVCDKKDAYVINRAQNHNIKTLIVSLKEAGSKVKFEEIILNELKKINIDLICLAGYMKRIDQTLLEKYEGKIINIHPALLPSFKGAHGISDAFNYGVKLFGVSVHYVNKDFDCGKIIMQRGFEYYGDDITEVETKIHQIEHKLYIEAINKVLGEIK